MDHLSTGRQVLHTVRVRREDPVRKYLFSLKTLSRNPKFSLRCHRAVKPYRAPGTVVCLLIHSEYPLILNNKFSIWCRILISLFQEKIGTVSSFLVLTHLMGSIILGIILSARQRFQGTVRSEVDSICVLILTLVLTVFSPAPHVFVLFFRSQSTATWGRSS